MAAWLARAALRLIPAGWREAVARDIEREANPDRSLWFAVQAARVGIRLRLARLVDALTPPRRGDGPGHRSPLMRDFGRDVKLAVRSAIRRPAYTVAVVATLAVGIGANTAIYSVFNWVLLRPVPGVRAPHELVTMRFQPPDARSLSFISYMDYADLRDGIGAFCGLAAASNVSPSVVRSQGQPPERLEARLITANYFDVLGVRPNPGRSFSPEEERPSAADAAVVISHGFWRGRLASDPHVIGRRLTVNGHPFTIVGVAPRGFGGERLTDTIDMWFPLGTYPYAQPDAGPDLQTNRRKIFALQLVGRLRPGATLDEAQQQALAVARRVRGFGRARPGTTIEPVLTAGIGLTRQQYTRVSTVFTLLMGTVGLVLLLACANAANLLLARAVGRRREFAVCRAIGASQFRIVRQQLAEGLVLSAAAGIAGLGLALWLTSLFEGSRILPLFPALAGVGIDWRVAAFTTVTALFTGVIFALAPAWATSRVDLQAGLKDGVTSSSYGRPVLRASLATVQVALSIVLVLGAGLFVRSLHNARALDLGMDPRHVITFSASPASGGYGDERAQEYFRTSLDRLRQVPGVRTAAYTWATPYAFRLDSVTFARPETPDARFEMSGTDISSGYFETMGMRLVAGRDFTAGECLGAGGGSGGVVILSEMAAHAAFPDGGAIGSTIVLDEPGGPERLVVGIVGDVRNRVILKEPEPMVYLPAGQESLATWGTIAVRSELPFATMAAAIREAMRTQDPALPVYELEPLQAAIDRVLSEQRLFARLGTIFGAIAALLATVGLYGMMASAVVERRREFGIRLALGAETANVLRLVLRSAMTVAGVGVAIGVAAALALGRLVESRLFGITPHDPATIAFTCVSLVVLAILASSLPAFKASRVNPLTSLRTD